MTTLIIGEEITYVTNNAGNLTSHTATLISITDGTATLSDGHQMEDYMAEYCKLVCEGK